MFAPQRKSFKWCFQLENCPKPNLKSPIRESLSLLNFQYLGIANVFPHEFKYFATFPTSRCLMFSAGLDHVFLLTTCIFHSVSVVNCLNGSINLCKRTLSEVFGYKSFHKLFKICDIHEYFCPQKLLHLR